MNAEKAVDEENMKGWTQKPQTNVVTAEPC